MNKTIFALDIGTRSVTGILLEKQENKFEVIDYYVKEHNQRSMRDGQIHNVLAVSAVIQEVKAALSKDDRQLHKVYVAAAGRALKTVQAQASTSILEHPMTNIEMIKHLELSAVQAAQLKLVKDEKAIDYADYYCVGYSVLYYKLDQEQIGSLIDQHGKEASVEVIATFLPKVVVESLLAALERSDLEMEALTLEPIAAIHVLIPESMRRLNVVLVDIGAGTSDIAITDKGTIVAYGMVPIAGDKITEVISDTYLLDYPLAEQMKQTISLEGEAVVNDILGFETIVSENDFHQAIQPTVNLLATAIADEILRLNREAPKAVMLIGGGSLTPGISELLANKLNLPENRVAIRTIEAIQNLHSIDKLPQGPDFVTPVGIAVAADENRIHYLTVKINGQNVRMFEMKQLNVGDCLVQMGIDINTYYGRSGTAITALIDGKEITLPGSFGGQPIIHLNNIPATVDTLVGEKDVITITKGIDGINPEMALHELIGDMPGMTVFFNSKALHLPTEFYVNGNLKTKDYLVQDKDQIMIKQQSKLTDFLAIFSTEKLETLKPFSVFVNKRAVQLTQGTTAIQVNNRNVPLDYILNQHDHISIHKEDFKPTVNDVLEKLDKIYWQTIEIKFNGQPIEMKRKQFEITRADISLNLDSPLNQNDYIELIDQEKSLFIFQDVFRYIDLDLAELSADFKLAVNDLPATFDTLIHTGDVLTIK